jgi:DNA polymerase-3 subunit beta
MRIELERTAFARLLAQVNKVVEKKNTIPILGCVRLAVDGGVLTATTTDLDTEISGSMTTGDSLDTEFCVDALRLEDIVKKVAGNTITMDVDGNEVVVKAGRSRFTLYTLPASDFPTMSTGNYTAEFSIDLAALFAPVTFAMSSEEVRYYLNGVLFQANGSEVIATATDGHRLATNRGDLAVEFRDVIVPRKVAGMLPKGKIDVAVGETKIRFSADGAAMTSKLVDGTFPDYERVIPKDNDKHVTFNGAEVKAAADRVAIMASGTRAVRVDVHSDEMVLSIRGDGEALDSVAVTYSGEPLYVGFNSQYLVDAIGNMPAGEINMAMHDAGSPVLLTSKAAPGLRCVLMPMRVG